MITNLNQAFERLGVLECCLDGWLREDAEHLAEYFRGLAAIVREYLAGG